MITYCGHKVTANELAKIVVSDRGLGGAEYWSEDDLIQWDTETELRNIESRIEHHAERLYKFMGMDHTTKPVASRGMNEGKREGA